ncbi:MAG: type II secretion system F family protein [Pseudomonadota bacterium]
MDLKMIMMIALAALTVGALLYAFMYNSIASEKKTNQRVKSMQVDTKTKAKVQAKRMDEKQRRKLREETLKNVDAQRATGKKAASVNLPAKLVQAGMTISVKKFYVYSILFGLLVFVALYISRKVPVPAAFGLAFVAGFGVPRWFVGFKRARRFAKFTLIFPNAIDIIVRGIKSGLPLNDCLRIIANDSEEPVRGEFRKLVESTQMGIPVPDACERLYQNIPTAETNFFAIVIAIQSSAGGNLSEALANLSKVLRERRKMSDKIKAFSTEAKTSAIIIGSLPFIVASLVAFTTPGYLNPLFDTQTGNKIVIGCAISMAFGIFVMKKMINFKF